MFGLGPGRLRLRAPLGTSAEADLGLDAGGCGFLDCHKLVAETHDQRLDPLRNPNPRDHCVIAGKRWRFLQQPWGKLGDLALS